jgi:hypothetical protein
VVSGTVRRSDKLLPWTTSIDLDDCEESCRPMTRISGGESARALVRAYQMRGFRASVCNECSTDVLRLAQI